MAGPDAVDPGPVPTLFVAVTMNVYVVPLLSPVTVQLSGPDDQVQVWLPPPEAVTVYPVIAAPPFDPGADHDTVTCASPGVAVVIVGEPGTEADATGVTEEDAADAGPVPTALVAVTVNVYAVPLVSPLTVHVSGPVDHVHVFPSGLEVTV